MSGLLALARFEAAAPFLASLSLVLIGVVVAKMVERRMQAIYKLWGQNDKGQPKATIPYEFTPTVLAQATTPFVVDAGQALSLIAAPGVGFYLLNQKGNIGTLATTLYTIAVVLGFVGLGYFLITEHPDKYRRVMFARILTPVALLAIVLNGGFAAALLIWGP